MLIVILNVSTINSLLVELNTILGMSVFKNLSKQVTTYLSISTYWQGCSAKGRQWRSSAEASLPAAVPAVLLSDAAGSTHVTNDYINLPGSPRIRNGENSVWKHMRQRELKTDIHWQMLIYVNLWTNQLLSFKFQQYLSNICAIDLQVLKTWAKKIYNKIYYFIFIHKYVVNCCVFMLSQLHKQTEVFLTNTPVPHISIEYKINLTWEFLGTAGLDLASCSFKMDGVPCSRAPSWYFLTTENIT